MKRIDFTREKLLKYQEAHAALRRTGATLPYALTLCALAGVPVTKVGTTYRAKGGGSMTVRAAKCTADKQMLSLLTTIDRLFRTEVSKRNKQTTELVSVASAFATAESTVRN